MSNTIGNTKDLDSSRKQALQGLLSSLGHDSDDPSSDAKLHAEQLQKLSQKINEILGDDSDRDPARKDQPNQLLNEDGLPIIDISEPLNEESQHSAPSPHIPEQELIPSSLLPPDERERQRCERERILDLLEEEERLQQLQEERCAEEERKEAIRKRKESTKAELERLKAARELQKKMGQALVWPAERKEENRQDEDARNKPQITSPVAKKSPSFADASAVVMDEKDQETPTRQPGWGDIAPGRLRAQDRMPLVSTAETQKYPMKIHVVERRSVTTPASHSHDADSDDEPLSVGNLSPDTGNELSDEEDKSLSGDIDEPLEEGFDYDAARHHREIALEYHRKRDIIGAEAAKVVATYDLDDNEEHETYRSSGRMPLSRFRADRMVASYDKSLGPVPAPIGQHIIPASRRKSLRSSVRFGKLANGQLVGGDSGESGSEDGTVREVIQMLRTGNIKNAGPDFQPSSMSTFPSRQKPEVVGPTMAGPTMAGTSAVADGIKLSRFGLVSREGAATGTTLQDDNGRHDLRSQLGISSVVERKAPAPPPSQHFPIKKPPTEPLAKVSEPASPITVDIPSPPVTAGTVVASSSSLAWPMKIGSPSPNQMQPGHTSSVESSGVQGSIHGSPATQRDSPSRARPISKFMAARRE